MKRFRRAIRERVLIVGGISDSLPGKSLFQDSCRSAQFNLQHPDLLRKIFSDYAEAGADVLIANSFGVNRGVLEGLQLENEVDDLNRRAVELVQNVAGANLLIGGGLGTTGQKMLPGGERSFDDIHKIYTEQIHLLSSSGVDFIIFDGLQDIRELRAGVIACRDTCDLPIVVQICFDGAVHSPYLLLPEAAAVTLESLRVDVVGSKSDSAKNNSLSFIKRMRAATHLPMIAHLNEGGSSFYDGNPATPEVLGDMSAGCVKIIDSGVRMIDGASPMDVRSIRMALEGVCQQWEPPPVRSFLSSRNSIVEFGLESPCLLVGDRINPTGKSSYSAELREGKTDFVRSEAVAQTVNGAHLVDVNCGEPGVDEVKALEQAVYAVTDECSAPVVIDTLKWQALESALKSVDGKALINSVNGSQESLRRVLPLVRRYGAAVIGMTLDERGVPAKAEERVAIAEKIRDACLEKGIPVGDLVIDCLAMPVSSCQGAVLESLRTVRMVRERLGLPTLLGISNVSFGHHSRSELSSTFLGMAMEAGLNLAMVNPNDPQIISVYRSSLLLLGQPGRQ